MDEMTKKKLQATACRIRMGVVEGTYCAKSGHPGGSLSICDTLTYLYFAKMHVDPKNPEMADRDRLVLSKGHCAPALYATLAERGFFPKEELKSLRQKIQLPEELDIEFDENYDRYVQQAQNLLFKIGRLAKRIPLYRDDHSFDAPQLMDCLNRFSLWDSNIGLKPDVDYYSSDYADEVGFSVADEDGHSTFYHQHFFPEPELAASDEAEVLLVLRDCNHATAALFDSYITFVQDLLRVQTTCAGLLEDYLHAKRRFLNESEITACLMQYLRSSENRSARLQAVGAAQMRYEIVRWKDGVERLCETVFFDSLGAFLYVDFFHGLNRNYLPRKCENCHRWFLLAAGKYSSCCNRPLKNEPGKTCRDVGSRKRYDDKCKNDPIWLAYNRAYKTHYARYLKKKMTTAQFEQWSRYAVELRQRAEAGEMELADYQRKLRV